MKGDSSAEGLTWVMGWVCSRLTLRNDHNLWPHVLADMPEPLQPSSSNSLLLLAVFRRISPSFMCLGPCCCPHCVCCCPHCVCCCLGLIMFL